ncbi:MAG: 3-(3-hydroxy-phenyl)propionate hydroxylase, partial [Pseudonocardiales bacterium]|nr:3-(3-hydroxy-phenyl)propionate hydroxylase [Pseudonocardiales bacterium]
MNTPVIPVVIVGAGPSGVTAATLLAQYGIECLVLDRWAGVYPQPRAVHLDDEICRILAYLGIGEEFAAISRPALGLRLLDQNMRVLAAFCREHATSAHGFPEANMFDQPELEALLRANLEKQPTVRLRGDVEVTEISQDGRGRVQVDFTDHLTDQAESVLAHYVLGCDGANSVVRSAIGARMEDLGFTQRWLVMDIATKEELGAWEGVHQVCDPVRAATYMRIGKTRYRWEFRLQSGETAADYTEVTALQPLIAPWTKDIAPGELEVVRVAEYTFRAQLADRWRHGRIFLLGDAAHLTPPFIGQGMGAGLRDAMNLAWKLAGVLHGSLAEEVLDSYETERKPHVRSLIRLAILMGWALTAGGELGDLARRLIAPRLRLIPGFRQKVLDSKTPPLRRSALVHRGNRVRNLAGKLCPNPVIDGHGRLDDLVAGRFVLVTDRPLSAAQRSQVEARGAAIVT